MSRILLVLGAGVSKDAGVPVMADFFEQATILSGKLGGSEAEAFRLVAKARAVLQTAQSKARFDLRNLESVFGAFEMAELLFDSLSTLEKKEIDQLSNAMRQLIVSTIENSMKVRVGKRLRPPMHFDRFGALVKALLDANHEVAVVTFNYDIAVELGLLASSLTPSYRLNEGEGTGCPGNWRVVEVLKLHGSLNWTRCDKCQRILVQPAMTSRRIVENHVAQYGVSDEKPVSTVIEPSKQIHKLKCSEVCEGQGSQPLIVPPTSYKMDSHKGLKAVWRRAAEHLGQSDSIFVLGYSWPATDLFFHQLFALGSVGDTILSRFWVCNPASEVRDRFRVALLGQQALDCFGPQRADAYKFKESILAIAEEFEIPEAAKLIGRQ